MLHQIEDGIVQNEEMEVEEDPNPNQCKVIIIDGMAVVNQLNKNSMVKTCKVSYHFFST